ncbi:hypothetical protein DLAC_04725 [Tieghemostelium lacteum]|uniref:Uncharacterized protein n=1 Tax=Tieghemostelium lacteum TaxID=361077 RepID=A0A151ZKA8_TIELA|nr:hypothetical protein DLAC_04725 [Tieghemostelium lacteum]|eukprot:KYQ94428.1 hypothetical protein DLAC_04725 [Tieghemostelium lacteum]
MKNWINIVLVVSCLIGIVVSTPAPTTPAPTATAPPTSSPLPPTPSVSPPNYLWGIFSDEFNFNFNISQYDIISDEFINYPLSSSYCSEFTPHSILFVNSTTAVIVAADLVSMNIIAFDLQSLDCLTLQTIDFQNYQASYPDNSFGYNYNTSTLYNTGYLQAVNPNATIFAWNFAEQIFNSVGIEDVYTENQYNSVGVYDANRYIYYVIVFDSKQNANVVYAYSTMGNGAPSAAYVLQDSNQEQFQSLLLTSDGTLYGVTTEDEGYLMVYLINYLTGEVSLYFHTKNSQIYTSFPAVAYGQYLLLVVDGQYTENSNQVVVLNTHNRQTKTYTLGNGSLPVSGSFYIASN